MFDMGDPIKIYDLAYKMIKLAGLVPDKDIKIVFSGLRPGEKLFEELLNDSEITEFTPHAKIKMAKVREYTFAEIAPFIENIISNAHNYNTDEMVKDMKGLVPEFVSQNSIFEIFDVQQQLLDSTKVEE